MTAKARLSAVLLAAGTCLAIPSRPTAADEVVNALALASMRCDVKTVQELVRAGVKVNARVSRPPWAVDGEQLGILHVAAVNKVPTCADVVRLLIGAGADVNARGGKGSTPLMIAARQGSIDAARALVEAGADVTLESERGDTATSLAGKQGHAAIIALLNSVRVPISQPTASGQSDRITLKNGDVVTGDLLRTRFSVQSSYASLAFDRGEVKALAFEGDGRNIEVLTLRNGDRLSGSLGPGVLRIRLPGGQEIEIGKEKIRQVQLRD